MSSSAFEAADRMHSASIHLLRRAGREDVKSGTSGARLSALSVLVFAGPKTVSELAGWERVKVPTMSRLVAAMEAEGLVRKVRNGADGRSVVLHPTAKGRRLLDRARELRLSALATLFAGASAAELETVRKAAAIVDRLVL
jgi:DNA-binding MarR family transcriptional regulator